MEDEMEIKLTAASIHQSMSAAVHGNVEKENWDDEDEVAEEETEEKEKEKVRYAQTSASKASGKKKEREREKEARDAEAAKPAHAKTWEEKQQEHEKVLQSASRNPLDLLKGAGEAGERVERDEGGLMDGSDDDGDDAGDVGHSLAAFHPVSPKEF